MQAKENVMLRSTYDAIVIGAGHNGLAAATTLSRKGHSVLVLEQHEAVGGMAKNIELSKGVFAPEVSHLLYNLNSTVAKELGIGTKVAPLDTISLPTVSLAEDGAHIVIKSGQAQYTNGTAHPEATKFSEINTRLIKFAELLGQLSTRTPPFIEGGIGSLADLGEATALAKIGLNLKLMGKKNMREFLRVLLSNIFDHLLDDLADSPLSGALAADAVRGAYAGPRAPGTVFTLMYRLGNGGHVTLPKGGMGAVAQAFSAAAVGAGVKIRTQAKVAKVLVDGDRATGIELSTGEVITARAVLSNLGPKSTMMLAGVQNYDVEATRRLRNHRAKGTTAKVNLVLSRAPTISGLSSDLTAARLIIAPSATYVERAFNPVKYGELTENPVIEAVVPTLSDPTITADGKHILSAIVSFVPHNLVGGWTDTAHEHLAQITIKTLEKYAPNLGSLVLNSQVLSPKDIEALSGAPGGHWHHGEMGRDQILTNRPANQLAHYRFGPEGYYLCGASAHPGGDVMGAAGRNAALQVMKDGVLK
jgi:phytoene dehydrogenase-like protein